MKIGIWELIVIAIVALLVLGPDKLPVYAKKLGQALGEIKKYSNDLSNDIKENIVEPLNEVAQPLKDAVEPINTIQKEIKTTVDGVTKSFNDIGKTKKEEAVEMAAEVAETEAESEVAAVPEAKEMTDEAVESAEKENQAEQA